MAPRRDPQRWMVELLGKEASDALFKKVHRMAEKGATAAKIERMIAATLKPHIKNRVADHANRRVKGPH